jgi:hypothetical protein
LGPLGRGNIKHCRFAHTNNCKNKITCCKKKDNIKKKKGKKQKRKYNSKE